MTSGGEILITARRFRTQDANRADARRRLAEMIAAAHIAPRKRKPTRPTRAAKAERVENEAAAQRRQAGARKGEAGLMYDFKIEAADKPTLYRDLASALEGLIAGEPDAIANMANAAALIWESLARRQLGRLLSQRRWRAGGRAVSGQARMHPHSVRQRCLRRGCRRHRQVQRVEDVHAFPGHIACDSASNSEIVVPIVRGGELIACSTSTAQGRARSAKRTKRVA